MHKRKIVVALFALLAIAVVAAGCGGGGSSSDTSGGESTSGGSTGGESTSAQSSGGTVTKAAFIKQADAVCLAADEEVVTEVNEFAKQHGLDPEKEPSQSVQVELVEEVVLPDLRMQHDKLAELTPPEGEEDKVEELLDSLESGIEEAEGDPEGLTEGKNPLGDASEKAKAFGLRKCGAE